MFEKGQPSCLSNIEIAMKHALRDIKARFNLLCQNSLINLVKLMSKRINEYFVPK